MKKLVLVALAIPFLLTSCAEGEAKQTAEAYSASVMSADMAASPAPPTRRVWTEPDDFGSVSPTEPMISYVDWTTGGDVAVHHFATGEDRLVTDHGKWIDGRGWAENPIFSEDGDEIAYAYGNVRVPQVQSGDDPYVYQLRIVGLDGSDDRSIWQGETFREFISPMNWSDERGIVAGIWTADIPNGAMALISHDGGAIQVLKEFGPGLPCPCVEEAVFSPDGSLLAYREKSEIRLWDLEAGTDRTLGIDARTIAGWAPDGSGVLIHTMIDGTSGFWMIPLDEAGNAAPPSLVRGGIPFAVSAGRKGDSYYYYLPVEMPQMFQASVDLEMGRALSSPAPLTPMIHGMVAEPKWSPNGQYLAYAVLDADRNWSLHVRSADGNEVTALADLGKVRQVDYLRWSEDGSSLHYMTYVNDQRHLNRTDARTGATEEILVLHPDEGPKPSIITPDGTKAIISRGFPQGPGEIPRGLVVKDLATGEETVLSPEAPESIGLSPDGSILATLYADPAEETVKRLTLRPLDGRAPTVLAEQDREIGSIQRATGMSWSPDGRFILATYWTNASGDGPERYDMMAFPVGGGRPVPLGQVENVRAAPTLHPDGRRMVFIDGNLRGEIWVMEGWKR